MKVRLKAWVENMGNGTYRVHCNDGSVTYPTYDYQSVVRKVNYINNEDSDGHYFDDGRLTEDAEKMLAKIRENKIAKANHREEVKNTLNISRAKPIYLKWIVLPLTKKRMQRYIKQKHLPKKWLIRWQKTI